MTEEMGMYQHRQNARPGFDFSPIPSLDDADPAAQTPAQLSEDPLALLIGEANHRIRNLLANVEATVRHTQSTTVEDYRAKLIARMSGLRALHEMKGQLDGRKLGMTELLEQTLRPFGANGGRVFAVGPDLNLEPRFALALHLVVHELATNANKYGALSSPEGSVRIRWDVRQTPDNAPKLAIVWTEDGGPEVKRPRQFGFGLRLIMRALNGYGEVRLDFNAMGVACLMLIDLDPSVC
jgi:two-component sensor histidine kinase